MVSERDEKEIAAQHARLELSSATKELAANVLRVIAGAGKRRKLTDQILMVIAAYEKLNEFAKTPAYPFAPQVAMERALRSLDWRAGVPGYIRTADKDRTPVDRAKDDIVQAALRLVAAQLCAQPTQES